ncbi:MAG: hypothetical protein U0869_12455 [Chloroflexota bacterium]
MRRSVTGALAGVMAATMAVGLAGGVVAKTPKPTKTDATAAPAASAAPAPSAGPGLLGATHVVWSDDFSAPTTWQTGSDESGTTEYQDGMLSVTVAQDGSSVWDDHTLDAAYPVLRVQALIASDGSGLGGVACGSSKGLERWLYAGTDGSGGWLFGRIIDTRLQVIQRGDLSRDLDWEHVTMGIECASAPDEGGDHVVVTADGTPVTTAFDIPVGPYDKATILVAADTAPVEVRFDDMVVSAGDAYVAPAPGSLPSPAP